MHLSKVYDLPISRREAGSLVSVIVAEAAALMGTVWALHFVSSALKVGTAGLSTIVTAGGARRDRVLQHLRCRPDRGGVPVKRKILGRRRAETGREPEFSRASIGIPFLREAKREIQARLGMS